MTAALLRGRTFFFLRWRDSADDRASYAYEEDGAVLMRDGKIAAVGSYTQVAIQVSNARLSTIARI